MADVEIQMLEQQKLIEQLKSMIRERDDAFQQKEKELQDVNAKLSKMKLQAKAKLAKEAKELKENKGAKSTGKEQKEKQESTSTDKNEGEEESQGKVVRAKTVLLKKRLEESDRLVREKDETIELKDQQIEVKEKIIAEREEVIQTLTRQLEDKYKLMEELHAHSSVEEATDAEARVRQMYAQIVYKDKNLLELNNKILELERKLIDLQEFIGEKNEVIRGRDKVIELLQSTIRDKDQNITDQTLLISKLTGKVESNDETLGHLTEAVEKAEHDLKLERDRFNLRLTESQKYFEESLQEQEQTVSKLQKALADKENELLVSENDLRELIQRHERDIQKIMTKGEVNLQDPVIQMLEQKLKDTNEVLEGKIKVIEVLQKESSQKEKEVHESREVQKSFKDKLQEMSEQMMLFQANQVDLETQWLESRRKYEERIRDLVEKHETELTEKEVQIQNLKSTVTQMEGAYNQSLSQYSVLQERYQQVSKPGNVIPSSKPESESGGDVESEENKDIIADLKSKMEALQIVLREKEREIEELECLKQKSDSLNSMLIEMEKENQRLQQILNTKEEEMALAQKKKGESTAEPPKGDAKMLKMKAQLTAKVKSLEKEVAELKKGNKSEEIEALKKEIAAILAERDEMKLKVERMDEIQNLYESTSKKLAELEDVCTVQETEKRDLESEKDSVVAEKNTLIETIKDLQSSLDQKENVSWELKEKIKEQEKHIEEQLSVNIGLREELNATKDSLEKEMVLMEKLAVEKNELESEIKDYNCQIESLQQEKEKLVAQVDLLSETATGTDEKLLSYKQEIAQLTGKVTKLDEELIESCELSKKQKTEMNELLSSLVQIREEKSTLESDISTMNNKVAEHLKEIQDLQAVKDEQAVSIGVLRQELSVLKSESAVQKESLRQAGEDSNKLFDDTSKLQVKVVQLSQELQSKDQEIEAFKSEILQMTELCDGMQVRVKELICANESLNKNVKKLECDISAFLFENCDIQDSCDLSYAKKYIDELSFCNAELKAWIRDYLTKTSDIKTSTNELKSALMHIKQCYAKEVSDFKLDFKEMKELLLSYKNVSVEQEEKVSRYEKEVEKLSSDIAELSSSLEQRDLLCKQQSHEIDILREGQTTKGEEFESRVKSLLDEISNLEHQCTDLKLENEKLITELKLKAEKYSDLDNTVHNLQLEISEVKERNGSVVKEKDNEINTIQVELQRIVDEKESLVATLTGNVESVKNELTRSESRIDEYKAEVQHLTSILDEERSDKEMLNEQLKTLENSVFAKEEELKQLQIEFDQKCCECHQQEHAVKILSEEVDTLKSSLIEKSEDAKDLHDSCRNLKDELSTLQDLKDGLKEQCDIYLQSLQEKEAAHQQLTDDLSSLKKTHESALNDVHLELNKVFEELAQTREMKSNSDIQLAELQRQNKQLEEEKDRLSLQVQKDIQTTDGPQKQLEEAQRSLEKANTAVSTLEAKLQEKDEKIKSLVENMQEMEERLSQLSDTSVTQEEPETKTTNIENEIKSLKKAVEEKELKFTKALATAKKIKIQLNESNSKLENVKREKEEIEKELINMKKVKDDVKQNTETNKTARNVDEESSVSSPHSSEIIQDLLLQLQTYAEFSQQLQDQIQELTDRIHVSEKSHKKLEEDYEILKEEKRLSENSNLEKENIVLEVNQELKENKEALRNYISMLEEKEKMNLLLQQELQHVSLSLQNLQSRSDNVDAEGMQESMKEVNKWKDDYENINKVLEKSVADMSSQMQKYTELEEQCQGYMNTIQMMQTELRTSTSEIDKLKGKLNEETETRERLEIVLKDMNEELEGTEGILTDIKTENTKLVSENSAVNDTLRAMEINVSALKNDLQKKEVELAEHLDEILSLKKSNEKLEVQVGEKDMKLSHNTENLNEMSSTIQERDTELDTATNQISRLEENLSKLEDDMRYKVHNEKDMSEKLNSLSVENGKLNEQLDALKKDLNEKTEHCQMMSLKGNEDNETMLELHGKVDFLHTQACEYENTISALKTEISLLTQSSEIKEEYEHLKEQLSQILKEKEKESVEKNDMQEKLAAALVKEATARAALTVAEKEREDHFRLANQRQVELNENTILKDKLESDLKENQLKVKKHMQELERLQSEIRLKESDNETQSFEHSKEKEVITSHLDSLKQQNNSLHFQVDELKSMLEDAKQDNELLKGQLDMVSGECNLYKTSLDENNEKFMEMKEEKETLAKTQNEVKAQLVKVSEKLVAAESLKKELQLDQNKSHEENSALNNQVTTLQVEFQKVTADMDLLKSNYAKMLADHEIVMSECESNVIENKTLTELVDTLKTEKEELIKKMRELHNSSIVHHEEKTTKLDQNIVQEEKIEKVELQNLENKTSGSRLDIDGNIVTSVSKINEVENEQAASQIEKLQEQINELIKENVSLTEKSEADTAKFDKMLAKLKTFKERNDNYQVEVSELKQQLISSERVENSNIEHLEHKCSKLQSHLDATEEKLLSECKALQEKVVENTTLMNELSEMKARNLECEKEAENLDREKNKMLEMLKSEKEIYSKENILLSNKLSESQNRNVELLEEIDIYRAKLTLAESGVENDKKIIESLQKQISYLQKKLESENAVSLEREETIRDLKLKVVDSDAAKCEIENQGKMAQRQLQDVKDQYEMLEQDNKTFQDVISKSAAQNTELKNENIKQKMLLEKLQAKSNAGETQYAKIKELEDELVEMNNDRKYLEEEMDGLREDIIQMKKENSKSLAEKHAYAAKIQQLTQDLASKMQEIESMKWKLDEMEGLEEELNEIKREKDLLEKDKKDLQNELLKDRSNLESLMNENEKQKFIMETQEKKLNEFNEVDNKLKETVKTNENVIDELSHQMDSQQEAAMGKIKQLEEEVEALKQEIELCKTENISMKKQFDKANKQLQKFDILKKEYEALSEENNKLLVDKSNLAKHTEELHFKLRELSTMDQISEVDINHFDEAKKTLSNRISELEKESSDLRNRNAELSQEKSKLESSLQQAEFDRDSVHIQSSSTTDGNKYAYYQENSEKLHKQFSTAIQQKNKLQTDLNLAQRSSAQREARCQQLAMQVSQMAQDRSYLNTQLGILSKSLREKEQEIPQLQQQYRNLYQRYTALQTKVAEQDKRAILDLIQGSPAPSSGSVTPVEGHISAKTADIQNLEISMKERKMSQSSNSDIQNNIMMEPLEISMRERLGEVETHGGGDADTDDAASRIKGLQLMRQGNNSYLERIQRRLIIPSAIPPGKVDG